MGEENQVREALRNEVLNEFEEIKSLTVGSKEHATAIESLTKLYGLIITDLDGDAKYMEVTDKLEHEKNKLQQERELKEKELDIRQKEFAEEVRKNEFDRQQTFAEQKKDKRDTLIDIGIRVGGIVVPLLFYHRWLKMGMTFEKEGTFTSATFKGFFNKIKPTRID